MRGGKGQQESMVEARGYMGLIHGVVTAGMVFRDPPRSSAEQQERELQRGGGCTGLVFEVFLPDWGADVTPGRASSQGVLQECYPSRQLSDGLSSLLLCLVCLVFMCQCRVTKRSTWTYPKSMYVEQTGEQELIWIESFTEDFP